MDFSEILKNGSTIIASLAAIIASGTAIWGITAWRKEFIGKGQIELAEEALALFYEARHIIKWIRSPMGLVGEGSSREPSEGETPEEKKIRDQYFVVIERYDKNKKIFSKIFALRYRYMAKFGKEFREPFEVLQKVISDIMMSSRKLSRYYIQFHRGQIRESEKPMLSGWIRDQEAIFWEGAEEEDPIIPRIDKAVSMIEEQCKNLMKT